MIRGIALIDAHTGVPHVGDSRQVRIERRTQAADQVR